MEQAPSYYAEHIKPGGRYEVGECVHTESLPHIDHGFSADMDAMLVRGQIQSRHRSRTCHKIYILIDKSRSGADSVSGYSCSCPNGLRTVGCCAHVATVLWYLGHGRYLSEILIPASFLNECAVSGDTEQEQPSP